MQKNAQELLNRVIEQLAKPSQNQTQQVQRVRDNIKNFNDKLNDLKTYSSTVDKTLYDVDAVQNKNKLSPVFSKFDTLQDQTKEIKENTVNATKTNTKTNDLLEDILINLRNIDIATDSLLPKNKQVDADFLPNLENQYKDLNEILSAAEKHSIDLQQNAMSLSNQNKDIGSNSAKAIQAAKAYENIEKAVELARQTTQDANSAVANATDLTDGIEDRARNSNDISRDLLSKVKNLLQNVTYELQPKLEASKKSVEDVRNLNSRSDDENTATNA